MPGHRQEASLPAAPTAVDTSRLTQWSCSAELLPRLATAVVQYVILHRKMHTNNKVRVLRRIAILNAFGF